MVKPQEHPVTNITYDNRPVWRPGTHELILQKHIPYTPKRDPHNPAKFLPTPGPLLYTFLCDPVAETGHILEDGNDSFFSASCSDKGTYFGALSMCNPKVAEVDGKIELLTDTSNLVHLWNLTSKKKLPLFKTSQLSFKISPQENFIACNSENNKNFLVRSLKTNEIICSLIKKILLPEKGLPASSSSTLDLCAFSSDDRFLAYENYLQIQIIDLKNPQKAPTIIQGHSPRFFESDNLMVRSAASVILYKRTKKLPDPKEGDQTYVLECIYTDPLFKRNLQFGKTLETAIVLDSTQTIETLSGPVDGSIFNLLEVKSDPKQVRNIQAVSSDFSLIALDNYSDSICIKAINNLNAVVHEHRTHMGIIHAFFSPNNQYYFAENGNHILIWNFQKGTVLHAKESLRGFPLVPSSCSPDSKYLLVQEGPGKAKLFDLALLNYKKS
jgi:WD40 repeat protein